MVLNNKIGPVLIGSLAVLALSSCSSIDSMLEADRIDYKSEASKTQGQRLEIPPDLTQLQRDNRYTIPETERLRRPTTISSVRKRGQGQLSVLWAAWWHPMRRRISVSNGMAISAGWS